MSITVQNLTTLDTQTVQDNFNVLVQQIQEAYPGVDLRRGVVHDLVLKLAAVLYTANQENITLAQESNSLAQITVNPTLADTTTVNNVLSNYRITRRQGTAATGSITIVVSSLTPVTIANGAQFTVNGLTFLSDNVYNARITQAQVVTTTDRLLTATSGGYAFTIGVVAQNIGSVYQLSQGTALTPVSPPVGFVTAYATNSFTGGTDTETNSQLLNDLASGMAVQAWSNRTSNFSLLKNQTAFSGILSTSEVGYGDQEQLRYHSIFPVAFGGRTDLYVRTQALPQTTTLTKTATLIAKNGTVGTWQFTITSEDAPGAYQITKILQTTQAITAGGYSVLTDTRGWNNTATTFVPDINTALEATYSRYQTITITFNDTDTDATALTLNVSTRNYQVVVQSMPLIKDIQNFVNSRNTRVADVLVKAPIPCFMDVSFTINQTSTDPAPNTASLQSTVAAAVNDSGFPGIFTASSISNAVLTALAGTKMTISGIDMGGQIRRPDGTIVRIRDPQILTIPTDPTNLISNKTVAFYLDPTNVAITVTQITSPT